MVKKFQAKVKPHKDYTGQTIGNWQVLRQVDDAITSSGRRYACYRCVLVDNAGNQIIDFNTRKRVFKNINVNTLGYLKKNHAKMKAKNPNYIPQYLAKVIKGDEDWWEL